MSDDGDDLYLVALANLWRCDCNDDGGHVEIDFHDFGCQYALWYLRKKREMTGDDDED